MRAGCSGLASRDAAAAAAPAAAEPRAQLHVTQCTCQRRAGAAGPPAQNFAAELRKEFDTPAAIRLHAQRASAFLILSTDTAALHADSISARRRACQLCIDYF